MNWWRVVVEEAWERFVVVVRGELDGWWRLELVVRGGGGFRWWMEA